jgi:hypothetical protein
MAVRATEAAVLLRLDTDLTTAQIEAFIVDANLVVNNELASEGLASTLLTQIEVYVACHLCTLRDRREKSSAADSVSFGYDDEDYWAQAERLDPTGNLAQIGSDGRVAFIGRLTTEISVEQTNPGGLP